MNTFLCRPRLTEIFEAQTAIDRFEGHGDAELAIEEVLDALRDCDIDHQALEKKLRPLLDPHYLDPAYWAVEGIGWYEYRLWFRFWNKHPLKIQFVVTVLIIGAIQWAGS